MRTLRSFRRIIDGQTLVILLLSLAATYACWRLGIQVQLPEGLIAIAIIFPLGFAISAAFTRREKVLELYASIKAAAVILWISHRDWLDPIDPAILQQVREITRRLLQNVNAYLRDARGDDSHAIQVYANMSEISGLAEQIRAGGAYPSDAARVNRGLAQLAIDFERLRNMRSYRTPASLRAYSQIFLNVLPILFAPHFAFTASRNGIGVGLGIAALYATLLVSLDNIQEALEDPFDSDSEDDVVLDSVEFFDRTMDAVADTGRVAHLEIA